MLQSLAEDLLDAFHGLRTGDFWHRLQNGFDLCPRLGGAGIEVREDFSLRLQHHLSVQPSLLVVHEQTPCNQVQYLQWVFAPLSVRALTIPARKDTPPSSGS